MLKVAPSGFAAIAVDKRASTVIIADGSGGNLLAVDAVVKQAAILMTAAGLSVAFFAGALAVAKAVAIPLPAYFNGLAGRVLAGFVGWCDGSGAARRWQAVVRALGLIILVVKDVGGRIAGQCLRAVAKGDA